MRSNILSIVAISFFISALFVSIFKDSPTTAWTMIMLIGWSFLIARIVLQIRGED
jgi:hypothetical protein